MLLPNRYSGKIAAYMLLMLVLAGLQLISSCNSPFTPKPRGYFKISLPQHEYQEFNEPGFPYRFEYPKYAKIVQDSTYFDEQPENPYWINIDIPSLNGRIYISYNQIGGKARYKVQNKAGEYVDSFGVNTFDKLLNDSYTLSYKHSYKASSIEDSVFVSQNGISGTYFRIGGNTATANQFLMTDSSRHFLRGALYFDAAPNEDSLRPINNFLREDLKHLISTLEWKN
jgi:gliding motility-associated lipoprotein GldD